MVNLIRTPTVVGASRLRVKLGGLQEKHAVATWNLGSHLSIWLEDTGKTKKTCVVVAGRGIVLRYFKYGT